MSAAVPYLPVPNLIRLINARDVFPAAVSGDELILLAEAAERLAARARKEILNRWVEAQQFPNPPYPLAEGHGHD
jgi:hypothetical protein